MKTRPSAYFTKNKCWAYEEERRLVVNPKDITEVKGVTVLYLPVQCVSAIISGPKTIDTDRIAHRILSKKLKCSHYHLRIGRASCIPYFTNIQGDSYTFDGQLISTSENACISCGEPLDKVESDLCNWCAVSDDERADAAFRNPLKILHHLGLAGEYGFAFAGLRPVGRDIHAAPSGNQNPKK